MKILVLFFALIFTLPAFANKVDCAIYIDYVKASTDTCKPIPTVRDGNSEAVPDNSPFCEIYHNLKAGKDAGVDNKFKASEYTICNERETGKDACDKLDDDKKHIITACREIPKSDKSCMERLQSCSDCVGKDTAKCKKDCPYANALSKDEVKEAKDKAEEDFKDEEEKLVELQEDLRKMQEDSLEEKQEMEKLLAEKQSELNDIPRQAKELQTSFQNETEKMILTHIGELDKVAASLERLSLQVVMANDGLVDKRKELLDKCEMQARAYQDTLKARANEKISTRRNYVNSLSQALQTSSRVNCKSVQARSTMGGKVKNTKLRSACNIEAKFKQCQQAREFQTGLASEQRKYQQALKKLENDKNITTRQVAALERTLDFNLKGIAKQNELALEALLNKQQSLSQEILQIQQQMTEKIMLAEQQMATLQQKMMQAQFSQSQNIKSVTTLLGFGTSGTGESRYSDDDVKSISKALGIAGNLGPSRLEMIKNCEETKHAIEDKEGNKFDLENR